MPILSNRPTPKREEVMPTPTSPVVTTPKYQATTVDTKYESRGSLLSHAEGMPWQVTYYQQAVATDTEVSPQQLAKDAVYQQYIKIQHLEIRVTSELSESQDAVTKNFDVTGSAILYPPMVPNKGDMFLADIGDGREGVFAIIETDRLSIMKEACFQVEYQLVSHSTEERRQDLERKTIKRTHFVKRLLEHGGDPIVVDEEYHQYLSLQEYQKRLLGHYFAQFFDKNTSTLLLPNQSQSTYDPFLMTFISQFISSSENPLLRHTKKYAVDLPNRNRPWTLWDAVINVDSSILPLVENKLALAPSPCFGALPQFESIYFSNVAWVVYPHNTKEPLYPTEGMQPGKMPPHELRHQLDTTQLGILGQYPGVSVSDSTPSIYPVTKDDYYVFSKAFYAGETSEQSALELLVTNALNREPLRQGTLTALCDQAHRWPSLEQFYYIPLLLVMIKMVLRGQ